MLAGIVARDRPRPAAAEAVTAAIETTVTKQAHLQKLTWLLQDKPELLTGGGAGSAIPGGSAAHRRPLRGRSRPHQAPRLPALPARDHVEQETGRAEDLPQLLCPPARSPARNAETVREAGRPRRPGPPVVSVLPGQRSGQPGDVPLQPAGQFSIRTSQGPVCATCNPPNLASSVGAPPPARSPRSPASRGAGRAPVHGHSARSPAAAPAAPARVPRPSAEPAPYPARTSSRAAPACGSTGRAAQEHAADATTASSVQSLRDNAGNVRPELQALHQTLAAAHQQATVLTWLSSSTSQAMLTKLARRPSARPPTPRSTNCPQQTADPVCAADPGRRRTLRRDERLLQLERSIKSSPTRSPSQEKETLHSYAAWHVLRRLRQRIRGTHATHGTHGVARRNITAAVAFLDLLTARGLACCLLAGRSSTSGWPRRAGRARARRAFHPLGLATKNSQPDLPCHQVAAGPHPRHRCRRCWNKPGGYYHDDTLKPATGSPGCACSTPSSPLPSAVSLSIPPGQRKRSALSARP